KDKKKSQAEVVDAILFEKVETSLPMARSLTKKNYCWLYHLSAKRYTRVVFILCFFSSFTSLNSPTAQFARAFRLTREFNLA
ncbi:26069_t:CDS:1, partial [Gigaspora rosea]